MGTGDVSVASRTDTYENRADPEGGAAAGHGPPDYSSGLEDSSGFSDAAVRRGEGWRREREQPCLFVWSELRGINRIYSLIFFSSVSSKWI